jgi:hypothetical protein
MIIWVKVVQGEEQRAKQKGIRSSRQKVEEVKKSFRLPNARGYEK